MAQLVVAQPWWQRLGHHFSGARDMSSSPCYSSWTLASPSAPPQRPRHAAGLAPVKFPSSAKVPRSPKSARRLLSGDIAAPAVPAAPPQWKVPMPLEPVTELPPLLELEVPLPETAPEFLSLTLGRSRSGWSREVSPSRSPPRHPLEIMAFDEVMEANIELAALPGCNVIVRSQLDAAMQKQRELSKSGSSKNIKTLDLLKDRQVAWRRKHDALVHRKKLQAARFRSGGKTSSPQKKKCDEILEEANDSERVFSDDKSSLSDTTENEALSRIGSKPLVGGNTSPRADSLSSFGGVDSDDEEVKRPQPPTTQTPSLAQGQRASAASNSNSSSRRTSMALSRRGSGENLGQASGKPRRASTVKLLTSIRGRSPIPSEEPVAKKEEVMPFESMMALARKHDLRVGEVKKKWEQFHLYDANGDISLSLQEFNCLVRGLCGIADDLPIPSHLVSKSWKEADGDGDGVISFEEFLAWSCGVQYCEEMMVPDPEERLVRKIARETGIDLVDVERVKAPFDKYDVEKIGLEEKDFNLLICELLQSDLEDYGEKRMRGHWQQVCNRRGGKVDFAKFAVWWNSEDAPRRHK